LGRDIASATEQVGNVIRVLIADDHAAIRSGLSVIVSSAPGFEVVAEAADGYEAVDRAARFTPDVVLMDIRMPGLDGIEATARIVAEQAARVLILTTFDIDDYVFRALRAGASGFVLKSVSADDLLAAIESVDAGDGVLAPEVTRTLIDAFATVERAPSPTVHPGLNELTDREHDVLRLLGDGLSNADIARTLFIGETTVKTHVSRILTKFGVRSRVQAAIVARTALPRPRHRSGGENAPSELGT
jgi:DNA-binding NarL/FixJ family response regulator